MRTLEIVLIIYYSGDQTKENDMGNTAKSTDAVACTIVRPNDG
jgi:hypothetical protein